MTELSLTHSPVESARFGMRVARGESASIDPAAVRAAIDAVRADVAIVRIPASAIGSVRALCAAGLDAFAADTLVTHEIELARYVPSEVDPALRFSVAGAGDAGALGDVARLAFDGYTSHYHANPRFAPPAILDGYVEWACAHLSGAPDKTAWLVSRDAMPIGFSCCAVEDGVAYGVLNGVVPAARRGGVYREMLHFMLGHYARQGVPVFRIATHAHNIAVQRVWAAAGLRLASAQCTVHVNARG